MLFSVNKLKEPPHIHLTYNEFLNSLVVKGSIWFAHTSEELRRKNWLNVKKRRMNGNTSLMEQLQKINKLKRVKSSRVVRILFFCIIFNY